MMRLTLRQQLWAVLTLAFVARLLTLGAYPLTDTTEARYGEMARKMLETGQWIVPQIDYGIPFWGKPPLSFWLTATSYRLFGVSEFAARIPSLMLGVMICGLAYVLASRRQGVDHGLRAAVVAATSLLMMVSAGAVMTDPAMVLGTTLSMAGFWLAWNTPSRVWGYLFFVGLAIGLLAKGPVATVLTMAAIGAWILLTGRVREAWSKLPWVTGLILTAALTVPWYWAAEAQSPGFLQYFLVGEHWQRFTVSGWTGDLYGSAHAYPRGTIWLYALMGALPWLPWLLWQLGRRKASLAVMPLRSGDGWHLYLLCWMLAPALLFTLARNILPTYMLPGLVGFALLVAEVWQRRLSGSTSDPVMGLGVITPLLALLLVLVVWPRYWGFKSQKEIVAAYKASAAPTVPLLYFKHRPYSAEFYSRGSARRIQDVVELQRYLDLPTLTYLATNRAAFEELPGELRMQFTTVATSRNGKYALLREKVAVETPSPSLEKPH